MFRHLTLSWLALWIQSFSALALEEQLSLQSVVTTPTLTVFENHRKSLISKNSNWITYSQVSDEISKSRQKWAKLQINFSRENSYIFDAFTLLVSLAKLYKMRVFAAIFKHYEDLGIRRSSSKTYDNSRG